MKQLLKENTRHVNTGNSSSRVPKMERWNSFSRHAKPGDVYNHNRNVIGKLNPELEKMKI